MLRNITTRALAGRHEEYQYLDLIGDIISDGELIEGRNGGVKTVIGCAMCFSLADKTLPILTTKKTAWKTCLRELLWFIDGSTDNRELLKQNVRIWEGNGSREFLDSRGLSHLDENDLGPVYGHQWRHFNAKYISFNESYKGEGVDQLQGIVDMLSNPETRTSRRILMSAWNPCQLDEMALPPCHVLCQFNVVGNKLYCSLYQRSGDVGLGVPFNIASYSFLTHLLAEHCGLEAHEFHYYVENCHIYDDHLEALRQQIDIKPKPFPKFKLNCEIKQNIDDYLSSDIDVIGYEHAPAIKMQMRK